MARYSCYSILLWELLVSSILMPTSSVGSTLSSSSRVIPSSDSSSINTTSSTETPIDVTTTTKFLNTSSSVFTKSPPGTANNASYFTPYLASLHTVSVSTTMTQINSSQVPPSANSSIIYTTLSTITASTNSHSKTTTGLLAPTGSRLPSSVIAATNSLTTSSPLSSKISPDAANTDVVSHPSSLSASPTQGSGVVTSSAGTTPPSTGDSGLSTAEIAGIASGATAAILSFLLILIFVCAKRPSGQMSIVHPANNITGEDVELRDAPKESPKQEENGQVNEKEQSP